LAPLVCFKRAIITRFITYLLQSMVRASIAAAPEMMNFLQNALAWQGWIRN